MARQFNRVLHNKINYDDIILVDTRLENGQGLKHVMLLARVIGIKQTKLEVIFLASDNSAIWIPIGDCYYTYTQEVERIVV